jgi:addiction module HigA family antidote
MFQALILQGFFIVFISGFSIFITDKMTSHYNTMPKNPKKYADEMTPGDIFHPGEFVRDELEARNMSQQELADKLDISKSEMSLLLNGHRNITPAIAIQLEKVWRTDAEVWMNLQIRYDIDILKKKYKDALQKTRLPQKRKTTLKRIIAAAR